MHMYLTLAPLGRQLGDWYAAARIAGAPVPPPAVMSRATTVQVRLHGHFSARRSPGLASAADQSLLVLTPGCRSMATSCRHLAGYHRAGAADFYQQPLVVRPRTEKVITKALMMRGILSWPGVLVPTSTCRSTAIPCTSWFHG